MIPAGFISKWSKAELRECSSCQEHFMDLCRLVDHPTPAEADPLGESYCFERFAEKLKPGITVAYVSEEAARKEELG